MAGVVVLAGIAVVAAAALAGSAGSATETKRAQRVDGTVTLAPVEAVGDCRYSRGTSAYGVAVLTADCSESGRFTGRPSGARAAYAWKWESFLGPDDAPTGDATERGTLRLRFVRGTLTLTLEGIQRRLGAATPETTRAETRGTWRVKSGSGAYRKRRGSGRYTFGTTRIGETFETALIRLSGRLR
jgi:hypothetical protein